MTDDIDWMNASSDCGIGRLCEEMAALAAPFEAVARLRRSHRPSRGRRPLRVRALTVFASLSRP